MNENTVLDIKRSPGLRKWRGTGKEKSLGGRWSKQRVAEMLLESPHRKFDLSELARRVYGTNSKTYRDNVRKHISAQRVFMMARLTPFVTNYGPHGTIETIKLYVSTEDDDRIRMDAELKRTEERNEMSGERIQALREALSLLPHQNTV